MRTPFFLGLDVATTALKALITDARGTPVAHGAAEYPLATPRPGWSEQDPERWVTAAHAATRAALEDAAAKGHADAAGRIEAIGFSGQMHGAVFVDAANAPIRPCILWNDSRSAAECVELERAIGAATVLARTGNRLLPGFTAPKVRWLQKHEPANWARTDCILLPKDFVRLRLGSVRATDAADASGTLYFDVANRRWSMDMLHDLGIRSSQVPACHESPEIVDRLSDAAARAMGLRAGIPMVAGAGDQAANAIGCGIVEPGTVAASLGTSGVIFAASDRFRRSPDGALHAFCHALPGRWHLMSVMLSAAGSLRWFHDTLAGDVAARAAARGVGDYELLDREAAEVPAGCDGLRFLPTLAGERCPFPDPNARGAFTGISLAHSRSHFTRAVMEGVAASMGLCMRMIREAGIDPRQVVASGGGFTSDRWTQMHADAFMAPVRRLETPDGAARGAALLAAMGAGSVDPRNLSADPSLPPDFTPEVSTASHWQGLMTDISAIHRAISSV